MMMANPIDPAAARQAAARFMQAKGAELKSEAMQAPCRVMGRTADGQTAQEASPYYVFNAKGAQGFVVVSGDDCVGDNLVLGYTDRGSFDVDNVPVNMQEWLDGMASQISAMSRYGVKARAVALHDDIAPLMTTTWGQGKNVYDPQYPYNAFCPMVDGLLSCTGCMATALSQVLNYHRWPQDSIASEFPGYRLYSIQADMEPLPGVKFDWDNMVDDYANTTTTLEQQQAVAVLMRYCGQVLQMDYTPAISNAYAYDTDVLINKFGIDQGVYLARSNEYSVNEWDSLLYTELKEQRPLIHAGFSMGGGHAFVLDGYEVQDSVGYFHVNWGWDGGSDGFYRIDVLNPYASGTGGSSTSDGFCIRQNVVIGFQPAKSSLENYGRYLVSNDWNITSDGVPHQFTALNTSYLPGKFAIGMAHRLDDGTIDYNHILAEESVDMEGYSYAGLQEKAQALFIFSLPEHVADTLAPGSHRLVFVNKEVGTDALWRPIFGPNCSVEIKVSDDGKTAEAIYHPYPKLTTTARTVKVTGLGGFADMMMRGIKQTLTATVTNKSDDAFTGSLFCTLYYVDNNYLYSGEQIYETALFIEANSTADVEFAIYPSSVGSYVAVITDSNVNMAGRNLSNIKNVEGYVGQKIVTAKELTFALQNFKYDVDKYEGEVQNSYFDITVGNNTVMDYNAPILAKLYKLGTDSIYYPMVFPNGKDYVGTRVDIKSKERSDKRIFLDQILEPGDYYASFLMASDYDGQKLSDYFDFAGVMFTVGDATDIKVIDSDQQPDHSPWFSLDGRKLDARPTVKGVYVHQGKKFVVK